MSIAPARRRAAQRAVSRITVALAIGTVCVSGASAQVGDYPNKLVRLVVAYPPGGPLEAGRLRALAVTSKERMAGAPNVPTVAETLPGFEVVSWYGVLGPAGMPPAVVIRLNSDINRIIVQPDMKKRLLALDLEPTPLTPVQFGDYLRQNISMWSRVIKDAGVAAE